MAASAAGRVVLLVAQDVAVAEMLRLAVAKAGYGTTVVASAPAARTLLDAGLDPCVVLFAMGGDEDGREFIRLHNADANTARIPVIFFTAGAATALPIVSALVAFVERYCDGSRSPGHAIN
jgi:DNA-binding response OmpR family regulator